MKLIALTQGMYAQVDDEDFEHLNQWKWSAANIKGKFYAERKLPRQNGVRRRGVRMHRQIMNVSESSQLIDHRDHDTLNNQKANLLVCDHSVNNHNRVKKQSTSSQYTGVIFFKRTGKWRAQIKVNGKNIGLGYFIHEIDAAKAYIDKAKEIYGDRISPLLKNIFHD